MGPLKETYFANEKIEKLLNQWVEKLAKIKQLPNEMEIPRSTALLVLDMQNVFLSPKSHAFIPSASSTVPKINDLIGIFEMLELPIIFTQHITSEVSKDPMKRWWRHPIPLDDPISEISPAMKVSDHPVLIKHQYSAFFQTNLPQLLKDRKITTLIITGVMTHLCCETTARDGFMHGYNIVFPIDCSATYNSQLHFGTLQSIAHGFGRCLQFNKLKELLEESSK